MSALQNNVGEAIGTLLPLVVFTTLHGVILLASPAAQLATSQSLIQEITPATPYPTLCHSILPRTFERSAERIHPQGANRCGELQTILGITIKDDERKVIVGTVKKSIAAIASR